ncbi:MAG: exo-alpha-sialidase, partial [Candidatus Hydrogenedentes bacterium]|nr:exo-alpha-sialidase [Candidatus Hydrogenedentota bacterium]
MLIPGDSHEDLLLGPTLTTSPGNPPVIHMLFTTTDRFGHDTIGDVVYRTSTDLCATLSAPAMPPGLQARVGADGVVEAAGLGMVHHPQTDCILGIGALTRYRNGEVIGGYTHRAIAYAVLDLAGGAWSPWRTFQPPGAVYGTNPAFQPCPQLHVFEDGDVLVPFQWCKEGGDNRRMWSGTVRCAFDGITLLPKAVGNAHSIPVGRGLYEPELIEWRGRFYMTLRAEDKRGYLTQSDDGLHWSIPTPWRWDNGEEIAMDQTQTRLLAHSNGLLLVYTRIREDNGNVFRHRAPLHCAELDPDTFCVRRATERILFANKGLPMGNFSVCPVTPEESWVGVAE